ncbi:MAG: hypothetical protein KDB03_26250 [Planctomycetales bacterium]|nr:hypothetical protein [Planctomycetales bacterium]
MQNVYCWLSTRILLAHRIACSSRIQQLAYGIAIALNSLNLGLPQETNSSSTEIPKDELFRNEVAPILSKHCFPCHGGEGIEGGYSVANFEMLMRAGDSERPAIVPGHPEKSELLRRLQSADPDERMPPESSALDSKQVEAVTRWIQAGALVPKELEQTRMNEIWPLESQRFWPTHYAHPFPIQCIALNVLKRPSVWFAGYGEILQFDLYEGKLLRRLATYGPHISCIASDPKEQRLLISCGIAGESAALQQLHLDSPSDNLEMVTPLGDLSPAIAFSPDSRQALIATQAGEMLHLNWNSIHLSPEISRYSPHADSILALAWSSDQSNILTASRDRTARLYRASGLETIANFDRHERAVGGTAFIQGHPVTLDENGRLRLWANDESGRVISELSGWPHFLQPLSSSGNSVFVVAGSDIESANLDISQADDGKDEAGQPKKKTVMRLTSRPPLIAQDAELTSVAALGSCIVAGDSTGNVWYWEFDQNGEELIFRNTFYALP